MYLSRGERPPPCEEKVIDLMLKAQNFRCREEDNEVDAGVSIGRSAYNISTQAVETRQNAKLVLASVTNMRKNLFEE